MFAEGRSLSARRTRRSAVGTTVVRETRFNFDCQRRNDQLTSFPPLSPRSATTGNPAVTEVRPCPPKPAHPASMTSRQFAPTRDVKERAVRRLPLWRLPIPWTRETMGTGSCAALACSLTLNAHNSAMPLVTPAPSCQGDTKTGGAGARTARLLTAHTPFPTMKGSHRSLRTELDV